MSSTDVMQHYYEGKCNDSIPIFIVLRNEFKIWLSDQSDFIQNWVKSSSFKPKVNHHLCIPDSQGNIGCVLVITEMENQIWTLGNCPELLPCGKYHISSIPKNTDLDAYILGWGMGAYRFQEYKNNKSKLKILCLDGVKKQNQLEAILKSVTLVRDMINHPASDMQPQHIQNFCERIVKAHGINLDICMGDDLLKHNFPIIHAVGRASVHLPRLIQWKWGESKHPKVVIIGKGVSFDSGGLDIKSSQGMRLMKKDMGGGAHALGIASAVMKLNLPIQLHVLIPAVENAISGNAFRPGDVLTSRSKKTIEIDNTDAEGRLILCDAISIAAESAPNIIIDFATLTGAARVALGTEVPAFFTNDPTVAAKLMAASDTVNDPIWQLPLHKAYRYMLNSDIADITNSASSGYGGAITAALYLQEFVPDTVRWVHFDVMAWNTRTRPGRPKGGEAMGLRTVINFLQEEYKLH